MRTLGLGEIVVGGLALAVGGPSLLSLAGVYTVFTIVVVRARRHGAASCGCFGQDDEAPLTALHVVIDAGVAMAALTAGLLDVGGVLTADGAAATLLTAALLVVGVVLLRALLVDLPVVVDAMRRIEAA